jgi:signal transduction histidine kinase
MPDMDGIEVCKRIRQSKCGETPVLFCTALRDVDTFDRALVAGGDDFLTKPVHPTELVLRVNSVLRLRRLTGELREQYNLLKQQRDEMLRFQLYKERLTAFLVHDLKNPVNTLSLHAQMLQRYPDLPPAASASVTGIRTATRKLTRMISDLLDLSKADEGQLKPRLSTFEVQPLVDEVFGELGAEALTRSVKLHSSVSTTMLQADRDLVQRMLANLVENAIRHSPSESTVRLIAESIDGDTELRVSDEGQGIPPALQDKVFSAFVRATTSAEGVEPYETAAAGNRGLGLTFCKFVAEVHGGRIWVEDAHPGAVFCVRLPRAS